ncbi:capsular polysaccharide transport system permease protein [Pacificibacter maritimus]|uniref:Capsular polysaccharide transport system permease protein n=1 Tax=Pacificibacter maritimus TaxID=762213 RepID=A0A3N4V0U3_9RHOB|nr:capsule biosynthesis protein [Pacificibacter maritimus]RPE67460.1 capsular polysaccharide transport system permease protein [Pacificibacter maritimus]
MTTKPKAQKFRVRRSPRAASVSDAAARAMAAEQAPAVEHPSQAAPTPAASAQPSNVDDARLFDNEADADGFGDMPFPGSAAQNATTAQAAQRRVSRGAISNTLGDKSSSPQSSRPQGHQENTAQTGDVTPADEMGVDQAIDAIRREGLTGRQLRMARRLAQKHNLAPTSDFDAVRLLRAQGIDPFQRTAMLDMVTTEDEQAQLPATTGNKLPKTIETAKASLPPELMERLSRENEISQIQQDIAKRRRRKTLLLASRIAVFVGIPTFLAGLYYYTIATPMYATKSSFVIQQADAAGGAASGGLLSGTSFGGSQDSIAVQDYLESRDAMLRLDADVGFKNHFASEAIDPIQRLPAQPTNEKAYKVYKDRVSIGYDPTEGLLKMEVVAADPEVSKQFSDALITYAEERVDNLTQRKREDQMKGARESLEDAERKMQEAQESVVVLQEQLGVISPEAETGALMGQISTFETQLQQKQLQLQQLLDNARPNQARVEGTRGDIGRLENIVANLRSQMTQATGTSGSLARISAELRMAEVDLQTRQMMTQQAVQSLEAARVEANRQTRYLSLSSSPVAPDEPTYPRKFENTVLAFLLFSGIYLLASLTAAVLREQVSA